MLKGFFVRSTIGGLYLVQLEPCRLAIYIPFPFEGIFVECCTYAVSIYRWIYMLWIIVLYKLCLPPIPGRLYRVELSRWLGRVLI